MSTYGGYICDRCGVKVGTLDGGYRVVALQIEAPNGMVVGHICTRCASECLPRIAWPETKPAA